MQMNSMQMMKLSSVLSAILFSAIATSGQTPRATPYTWRNVQIVGGGFVDGVIFHPSAKNLRYARTDMGGAYRWDAASDRWQPMLDWVPYKDLNLMGIESIAVDPSDANRVYLACGTYTNAHTPNGAILRSGDRGRTFQRTGVPFKFGGNEDGRGNGERLAVDPEDGRVLYPQIVALPGPASPAFQTSRRRFLPCLRRCPVKRRKSIITACPSVATGSSS